MPYSSNAATYSCWPVFMFPYNLPPDLLMKEESMFLTLLIPGPTHPGRDIDVLLEPLIDELLELWEEGAVTYYVSRKENFNMKAVLLWTVSDFPAYEMLSGWGTHGRMACPYCMSQTKSFRLKKGGKPCWFDCHRCFLPPDHPFRRDKKNFKRGQVELDSAPPMLIGEELLAQVNALPKIKWGKKNPLDQIPGYNETHHWQKRSCFWELPYWATHLLRHNIDIMHLENNFTENIFYMLLSMSKTKDNAKARLDIALLCNRRALHLTHDNRQKPLAPYELSKEDKRKVLMWLKETVKFPDGYASSWSRSVTLKNCTTTGLKSHDFHVFMERLLPVAFRDFLPDSIWEPLCEISSFFREICAKELDIDRIKQLEKDIIVTLCKLEKQFPPGFFDSMEHLVIHVAREARFGGPIGPRWMYPCERRNKDAKMMVTNKARVEGSIVEATLLKDIATFCSKYFAEKDAQKNLRMNLEEEDDLMSERLSIFDTKARGLGHASRRTLSHSEFKLAHNYVILNCPELRPYLNEFDACMTSRGRATTPELLDKARQDEFADWLKKRVQTTDREVDNNIRNVALRPGHQVLSYEGYEINGFKFHTNSHCSGKSTINSGICVRGESPDSTNHDYYGVIEEIFELQYEGSGNKAVIFKCHWFDITNGTRVDDRHGLVEVKHASSLRSNEVFVLALQTIQVYYIPYASDKRDRTQWWVAMKSRRKRKITTETDGNYEFYQEEQPDCPSSVAMGQDLDWENLRIAEDDFEPVAP